MPSMRFLPVDGILPARGPFELAKLVDVDGALRVTISLADGNDLIVTIADYFAYRKRDEGDALAEIEEAASEGLTGVGTYEVRQGSDFLTWFHRQSHGAREKQGLRHFVLALQNDFVEVLSLSQPHLETPTP